MKSKKKSQNKVVYFIGIGGIGMSALARWYRAHGYIVKGSDLSPSSTIKELLSEGISVHIGPHRSKNVPRTASRVIYNQAIKEANPELRKAKKLNIPLSSYPQSLGELTRMYKTIAVAGAHGKSTTTCLISLILKKAKMDPTVIVGTKLKEFGNPSDKLRAGKNFLNGNSEYLIIEADEWRAAFLNYFPYAALITNIDREHLDYYKNLKNIKKAFAQFLHNVHPYGLVVLNHDDKNVYALRSKIKLPIVWYSLNSKEALSIKNILNIPGKHNLSNAIGAYTLTRALGIKRATILKAISEYNGAWRRSEYRGKFKGMDVYDDYGHHPTEIKATLAGFREKFPKSRIICIFQPHQRERLKLLFKDFVKALDNADDLILFEIYAVAGREDEANNITSQKLAASITKRTGKTIPVVSDLKELKDALAKKINSKRKNVIVMMGAGNINEYTDKLISNN